MRAMLAAVAAVLTLTAWTGEASAARVKLVWLGNDDVDGGWCDKNNKTLAPGASRSVRFEGAMDTPAYSQVTGKYRMKSQADKFQFTEPSVTFTQQSHATTHPVTAKSGAPAGTHVISFVAVDDVSGESPAKTCKIEIVSGGGGGTTTTGPQHDLKITFTAPTVYDQPVSAPVTFTVRLENIGTAAIPSGFKIGLLRFDSSGTGMSVAVDSQQNLPALSPGASQDLSFTETSRPALAGGAASRVNIYKTGITPYYTDKTNSNHTPEKGVRYIPATNDWAVRLAIEPASGATSDTDVRLRTTIEGTYSPSSRVCKYEAIPTLAGAARTFDGDFSCGGQQWKLEPGRYTFRVWYDWSRPEGVAHGMSEVTNYTVALAPHVSVEAIKLDPGTPTAGQPVTVLMRIRNASNGRAFVPWVITRNAVNLANGTQDMAPNSIADVTSPAFTASAGLLEVFGWVNFGNTLGEAQADLADNSKAIAVTVRAAGAGTPTTTPAVDQQPKFAGAYEAPSPTPNVAAMRFVVCNIDPNALYRQRLDGANSFNWSPRTDTFQWAPNGTTLRPPCPAGQPFPGGVVIGESVLRPLCGSARHTIDVQMFRADQVVSTSALNAFTVSGPPCPPAPTAPSAPPPGLPGPPR